MTSRREFLAASAAAAVAARAIGAAPTQRVRPVPTAAQLQWQRDEFAMFLHFGVNTFTGQEWGDGLESPSIFNPSALDTRQWARVAREAGARTVIFTAKHHDGFCLWPTRTTRHSIVASPWRGGAGDLVREFSDAARAEGLRVGLYCSPWDRNARAFGSPAYLDMYIEQLTELLTQYGDIAEVFFDGANGEGPSGRQQVYDWRRIWGTVRRLQPEAVMFSDAGPDVRWIGNERGSAGDPNWSTVNPSIVTAPGVWGPEIERALQHGDRNGSVWRPGETDVSIRPRWFFHESDPVKSPATLLDIWYASVGRNSKLLLNVPPDTRGLIAADDASQLRQFRAVRDALVSGEVAGVRWTWRVDESQRLVGEGVLPRAARIGVVRLAEPIERGQLVAAFTLSGAGTDGRARTLMRGQTIGYCRMDRVEDQSPVSSVRLVIDDAISIPSGLTVRLFES
jgi:alpha-L-fucosidase